MLKLLERSILTVDKRLVLLAPPHVSVPKSFENVVVDPSRRNQLIREVQGLRGNVYLGDGAVQSHELSTEGLHRTPEDEKSWHLLTLNKHGHVGACVWYLEHENTASVQDLRVRHCPLATQDGWRDKLWKAVESEIASARHNRLNYAEVGGWAVAKESRCTSEGLLLALAGYSLGRVSGGALGITTATVRHSSSTILRRLGGSHLEVDGSTVPSYYDPKYKCEMELLRFDSRRPSSKFARLIELLREKLSGVCVIARDSIVPSVSSTPSYESYQSPQPQAAV
jgi:hypothetical protein